MIGNVHSIRRERLWWAVGIKTIQRQHKLRATVAAIPKQQQPSQTPLGSGEIFEKNMEHRYRMADHFGTSVDRLDRKPEETPLHEKTVGKGSAGSDLPAVHEPCGTVDKLRELLEGLSLATKNGEEIHDAEIANA